MRSPDPPDPLFPALYRMELFCERARLPVYQAPNIVNNLWVVRYRTPWHYRDEPVVVEGDEEMWLGVIPFGPTDPSNTI